MRSPRGRGAGRRSVVIIATVLAASLAGTSVASANSHLESEQAAESAPAKIIVITPDDHVMLVDGKRRLDARICNADGSGCKDAGRKAKWSVSPDKGLKLSPRKGSSSVVEGKRVGEYEVTVKQGKVSGTTTVTVNEPPNRDSREASVPDLRLYITPEERVLVPGQVAAFTAWGCPLGEGGRLGPNGVADAVDDECVLQEIEAVNLDVGAPVELLGPFGPAFGLRLLTDEAPATAASDYGFVSGSRRASDARVAQSDAFFVGAQVVTSIGSQLPSVQADPTGSTGTEQTEVDEEFERAIAELQDDVIESRERRAVLADLILGGGGEPASGDVDGDGKVTFFDIMVLVYAAPLNADKPPAEQIYSAAGDMDGDGDNDLEDQSLIWAKGAAAAAAARDGS